MPGQRAAAAPRVLLKNILLSGFLCVTSLLAGAAALILAEFGAPVWIFVGLLTWLVTVGLPTLAAVVILATLWPGPSFRAFLVTAILFAWVFQLGAITAWRWGVARWRRRFGG